MELLHSFWTVVLWVEWIVLQWTLCGNYFTAGGQWYCVLSGVCYSEHYLEGTVQLGISGILGWEGCVTENIMWKLLHSNWTVVLWVEWIVLQWTLCRSYFTAGGQCYCGLNMVCFVNSMWTLEHCRWTVVLWVAWSTLQWTVCWRYFAESG